MNEFLGFLAAVLGAFFCFAVITVAICAGGDALAAITSISPGGGRLLLFLCFAGAGLTVTYFRCER